MPLKPEKRENQPFLQNHFAFALSNLVEYVMVLCKRLYSERYIFRHLQRQQTHLTKGNDAIWLWKGWAVAVPNKSQLQSWPKMLEQINLAKENWNMTFYPPPPPPQIAPFQCCRVCLQSCQMCCLLIFSALIGGRGGYSNSCDDLG